MRLGSLKKLDELETKKEIKKLNKNLIFLNKLVKNKKYLNRYLTDEIENTSKELNHSQYLRRTKIIIENESSDEISFDEFIEIDKLTITVSKEGLLKSYKDHIDINNLISNQKNIVYAYHIMSNQNLLVFTSSGRVFTIDPKKLPSGKSSPKNFIYFVDSNINDKLIKLFPFVENLQCIVTSIKAKGFIADLNNIQTSQRKGKQLFNLKTGDELFRVMLLNKTHLACVNTDRKLLIFRINELPILQKGGGVQLQKIKDNILLSDIQLFNLSEGIAWKIGSLNKNEKQVNFWLGKRAQSGKKVPKRFNKNLKFYEE